MNYDARGQLIIPSTPKTTLRTVKKTLHIDSGDRDTTKYYTNGDFVVYLPRVYERVLSIRLMSGEFPIITLAHQHPYSKGNNISGASYSADAAISSSSNVFYFEVDIEGLNKTDETVVAANGSGYADNFFAKIPTMTSSVDGTHYFIEYNDHSGQDNIAKYSPPISKLDRLHVRLRTHGQQGASGGFIYWTSDDAYAGSTSNTTGKEFCLTFELEYLDNGYDEYSSMQTSLTSRPNAS
jgi:hypothetical protein